MNSGGTMLLNKSAARLGVALAVIGSAVALDEPATAVPAAGALPSVAIPAPQQVSGTFLETFDGKPTNPEPWSARDWDVFQTSRNSDTWANPLPVNAHHALHNCGDVAAGGSHTIRTWPETVFRCNDHVMTSINGTSGYAAIYLSPPAMADFSGGPSTVSFDVSTSVSSTRDWLDVLITPFADAMSYPFRSDLDVDGSGLPRNAIHIEQSFGSTSWEIEIIRNGVTQTLGSLNVPYSQIGGQSRVTRTPVRIVVSRTSLTLSYPTVPGSSRTVQFSSLGWSQGIVQLGHHSYDPLKDCSNCAANTWHWDNVRISPARFFYQWQATPERTGAPIRDSNARQLSFGRAAPANAELMFSGTCGVQVRNSASSPWRTATIVGPNAHPEHTQSYRVSVPAGLTGVQFRFVDNGWYGPGAGCQLSNPIIKAFAAPATPPPPPSTGASSLFTWDVNSGSWAVRTMSNWTFQQRSSGRWALGYTDLVVGDFDRDGTEDDYLLWSQTNGNWVIQSLVNLTPQFRAAGRFALGYDEVVVGDFDGDGFVNDLFVWAHSTGTWMVQSMRAFKPTFRNNGRWSAAYDTMVVGDWDDDGRRDDAFVWDSTSGYWVVHSWSGFRSTYRGGDRWPAGYERAYNGDFNSDGRRDDLILWDDQTGRVAAFTWSSWRPLYRNTITFSSTLDLATAADLDNNRRWNEMFAFDKNARQWLVYRWLNYTPYLARAGTFPVAYDVALG